jgi:hypothetical protein
MKTMGLTLEAKATPGAEVQQLDPTSWRLVIPAGSADLYRLAQLDDYAHFSRGTFPWRPPCTLTLQARTSSPTIPGTWGFGLWNDPFGLSLGFSGATRRLPALPNAAWFFFASPPNYLSLRDDLPTTGGLTATFRAPRRQFLYLVAGIPALPGLLFPQTARILRRLARRVIQQDAAQLSPAAQWTDPDSVTSWHSYRLLWQEDLVRFQVDDRELLETRTSPIGPLGLVIWVDNQYAAFPPDGRLAFGTLPNNSLAWIEIQNLTMTMH